MQCHALGRIVAFDFREARQFLLESSAEGQVANGVVCARLALTHEEIAQLTGTSRETISRILSDLRRKHIVELQGPALIIPQQTCVGTDGGGLRGSGIARRSKRIPCRRNGTNSTMKGRQGRFARCPNAVHWRSRLEAHTSPVPTMFNRGSLCVCVATQSLACPRRN